MSDATRTTVSAAPAPREPARSNAIEGPSTAAGLSNMAIQQQVRGGSSLAGMAGAPLDNRSMQSLARAGAKGPSFAGVKPALDGASHPLPHFDRIQASFGRHDISGVRTITGGPARGANAELGARAFTVGDKIGFRDAPDVWLAAHETAHVVQQRDGAHTPGGRKTDPWEHHADRVADEVVGGRSAEPLLDAVTGSGPSRAPAVQLDKDNAHAQNEPEPFAATSADKPGDKKTGQVIAPNWMAHFGDRLVDELGGYLAGTKFDMPPSFAQWSAGAPADFAKAMWAPVAGMKGGGRPYNEIGRIIVPDSLDPLINAGRDAPTKDRFDPQSYQVFDAVGEDVWADGVVAEVGKIVVKRVIESLQREVPRWVSARNQLQLSSQGPVKTVDHDPDPKQVVKSHPIDAYVVGGLNGHVTVDYAAYRKANPSEAKLGDMHLGEVKTVPYEWLHDQGAWNWVHVLVDDATVEDVAYTLYGDSTYAHTMTGASPYFGVTNIDKLIDPALSRWMSGHDKAKKPASTGDDESISAPDQQMQKPSVVSDYVMLAEANSIKSIKPSGIKPDEQGRKVLLDRMNASLQSFQLITKKSQTLPHGGYINLTEDAYKRLQDRAFKVADRNNAMQWIIDWDRQTIAQNDLLRQSLNGITVAVAQYNNFSMWDKASLVAQQIGFMYLRVASLSEQATAGQEALAAANDQSKLFPALVMEQVLAEVRRVLHTEHGAKWDKDPANHDSRTDLAEHEDREAKLRARLARVRDELLQNQEGAAKDLQQLQLDLADLQTEVSLVYDMDAMEGAWQALYNDLSMVGVISGSNTDDSKLMSGKKGHDANTNPALLDLWGQWNEIYREYRYGDKKAAVALLKERKPVLKELLDKVAPLIKSNETKNKWITFAIMLGIALVTAGVGAYIEGAAAVAWGAESWATFAVTTGAEAFTFTTLSYGFVEKDPSIAGYFLELGKNVITFGALKGISNKYISFVGKDIAGTVDTMVVQFVAMNTASLVEADINKYRHTGQHLSLDEALDISKQNALFTIAAGIATAAAKPGLETLKLQGEADSALSGLRTAKAELQALALRVEGAKTADPAQVEGLLAKQREVLKAQADALKTLEKIAIDPKKAAKAGIDDPVTVERLETARQEHAESVHQLELATTLQHTEGAGPIRYAEKGGKWDSVVQFWKGEGASVEPVHVDEQFGSKSVDITTKEGDTFRLLERTADNAKAVSQTAVTVEMPGAEGLAPKAPDATAATSEAVGGTKSASSYTLSDTAVQTGKKVAGVANEIAPGLKAEGIQLGPVKAEPAKGGSKTASTTLTVADGKGGTTSVPVSIEVTTDVAASGASGHGTDSGHASFQIKPDGKGGWTVSIKIEARLANEADVASHLRHELREAQEILGELAKDPTFDIDAAQKSSSLTDPAKATAHDRAAAAEVRDLLSDLEGTIAEGEAARARTAKSGKGGTAKDRAIVQRGADARARLDNLLDSMGLTDPAARAEKIATVLDLAGVDSASPLGKFLDSYGGRTDSTAARSKALDGLDATTKTKVQAALGAYADLLPADSVQNVIDAVTKDTGGKYATKVADVLELRAEGEINDAQLSDALDTTAKEARAAEAETTEAGGKRLYKVNDPDGHLIGPDGLSKEQESKFRGDIDNAKTLDDKMQARWQRYKAKIANAVEGTLKAGEPWSFDKWEANNPQLSKAVTEGLRIEGDAISAIGATPNNDAGAYKQSNFYDESTNQVVTARPDAFLVDTPVESKYVDADSKEQVVYDTPQTRAERKMGGNEGHIMLLSQNVEPGKPPAKLRPSGPLAKSKVYFFDPALKKITFRWDAPKSEWVESTGPEKTP